jgi:signal transduction histidine kinase
LRACEHPPREGSAFHAHVDPQGADTSYRSSVEVGVAARQLVNRPLLVDSGIAVVLTAIAQGQAGGSVSVVDRLLLVVVTGAVAGRRRAPFVTSLVVATTIAAMALTAQQPSVFGEYLAVMLTAYTVAERCEISLAVLGGLAMVAGVIAHDLASPDYSSPGAITGDLVVPVLIWGVGRIVHFQYRRVDRSQELVAQLEREGQELARFAVDAERAHLARELHDVVTHSVSVVVIQAQGAQRVLEGQPEVRQSLADIESAGRNALTEMRRMLGLLRDDERDSVSRPCLADVAHLIAQVRAAGLRVKFYESGVASTMEGGVQLAAYRVVQEALTNALKYAAQAEVTVELLHEAGAVEILIVNASGSLASDGEGGRGLLGMRERVAVYGGTLETGPLPTGGFRVRARLPTSQATP